MYFNCKHCGNGVSTWAKFDGHIYIALVSCYNKQKYLPFIMYYGSAVCVVYRPTTLFSNILTD